MDLFSVGIICIILGLAMLLIEVHTPGFFIGVPGTVFVVIGIVFLIVPDVSVEFAAALIIITSVVATVLTMLLYKKLEGHGLEATTTVDMLVGKEGIVIRRVEPDNLKGKVRIEGEIWSATSDSVIEKGKKVRVVKGEGVHVVVREIK